MKYFFKYFLFLLLLFFVQRIIFISFHAGELKEIPSEEISSFIIHLFVMDISAACYILVVPFLLFVFRLFIVSRERITIGVLDIYTYIIVVLTSFINICDIGLYEVWGTRINQRALSYLEYPGDAAANAWSSHYLLIIIIFVIQCWALIRLYKKYFRIEMPVSTAIWSKVAFILATPILLLIGIRGGLQRYPLDKAWAYFSPHSIVNQSAMNGSWNFIYSLLEMNKNGIVNNPYQFFEADVAKKNVEEIHSTDSLATLRVLKGNRPNILLIMLESFSADVIEPFGAKKGITPGITELLKEGLLFTKFYSPGFRTEQGLAALISGFPSQPSTTILRETEKFGRLPSIIIALDSLGYSSSYYYGGDVHWAYTDSYLRAMGMDKIIGDKDFSFRRKTGWGAYDEELFAFFNKDMKQATEPFFSVIMTSTNHEPFDADVEKIEKSRTGDWCDDYINTVHYTDKCLKEFIDSAKKQTWYSNTLIVVVADHAHSCPGKFEYNSAERHHIPFFLVGGALKEEYHGKTFDFISSQVDFPATILGMLNRNHDQFKWSKNVLNTASPHFAFYAFDDGYGWINDQQQLVYDHKQKKVIFQKNDSLPAAENDKYINEGKAYLQLLMDQYVSLDRK